jgi:hypothetical protein
MSRRTESDEVSRITGEERFRAAVEELAERLGRDPASVHQEAVAGIREMSASHARGPVWAWQRLGRYLVRKYHVRVDEPSLRALRALDDRPITSSAAPTSISGPSATWPSGPG